MKAGGVVEHVGLDDFHLVLQLLLHTGLQVPQPHRRLRIHPQLTTPHARRQLHV